MEKRQEYSYLLFLDSTFYYGTYGFKSLPNFQIYGFYFKNPIHFPWLIIIYLTDFLPQNFLHHKLTIADSLYDGNSSKIISNFNFSKSLNKTQGFIPSKRWLISNFYLIVRNQQNFIFWHELTSSKKIGDNHLLHSNKWWFRPQEK